VCRLRDDLILANHKVQQSAKTRSWEAAQRQARSLELQFENGLVASPVAAKTVTQAIELLTCPPTPRLRPRKFWKN
jgi:hypothetical protein